MLLFNRCDVRVCTTGAMSMVRKHGLTVQGHLGSTLYPTQAKQVSLRLSFPESSYTPALALLPPGFKSLPRALKPDRACSNPAFFC